MMHTGSTCQMVLHGVVKNVGKRTFKIFAFYLSSESFCVVDFYFIQFLCGST